MIIRHIDYQSLKTAAINNQRVVSGSPVTVADAGKAFFVLFCAGTGITIKNSAGTTIISGASNLNFYFPFLRLDKGFEITGTNLTVIYCEM